MSSSISSSEEEDPLTSHENESLAEAHPPHLDHPRPPMSSHSHSHNGQACHGHSHSHQAAATVPQQYVIPPSSLLEKSTSIDPPSSSVHKPKPPPQSLWSQLLGGGGGEDEEEEEEEDEDEDLSGIQLLGQHLAKVKLEAEERDHQFRQRIKRLEEEKREQSQLLGACQQECALLKSQVKSLEVQITTKYQIEQRDSWIAQIEGHKADKKHLKEECDSLKKQVQSLLVSTTAPHVAQALEEGNQAKDQCLALEAQVVEWKQRCAELESTCLQFKSKLDKELELKWEMSKRNGWEEDQHPTLSVLEHIVHVVAPKPEYV